MTKKIIIALIIIIPVTIKGQFIDCYGIKTGLGLSNQYWNYKDPTFSDFSDWKDSKVAFLGQFNAEKEIGKNFAIRIALGYIQKGYNDDISGLSDSGDPIFIQDNTVRLHYLNFDLATKLIPFRFHRYPYVILGVRADYLVDYKGVNVEYDGNEYEIDTDLFEQYNKPTYGLICGLGFSFADAAYIEIEYNPGINEVFESDNLNIKDYYLNISFGVNINKIRLIPLNYE